MSDDSINNAFQQYRIRNLDQGEKRLDTSGFRMAIVDAYFREFLKLATNTTSHSGNRLLHNPAESLQYGNCEHWIVKGAQRRCVLYGCKGTSKYVFEKCNVGFFFSGIIFCKMYQ